MRGYKHGLCVALLASLTASAARAAVEPKVQLSSDFPLDLVNPESSVPPPEKRNAKPLEFGYFIQDLIALAVEAGRRGDHRAEAHFYRAFSMAVPDRSVGFSKLCEALEAAGDRQNAEAACRDALGRPGLEVTDYARFVRLVLAKPDPLTAADVEDITQIVAHLQSIPASRLSGTQLQCEYAMHVDDLALLKKCSEELSKAAPDDPKAVTFTWAAALRTGDKETAKRLIDRAKKAGIKPEGIRRMEQATSDLHFGWRHWLTSWPLLAGALLLAGAAMAVVVLRRKRSLQQRYV
jgi:hypothetical protein